MLEDKMTVKDMIVEALKEAKIMEMARDTPDDSHMLYVAQRLSGAPFSFIEQVFRSM
jgi:hypothetical protein